MKQWILSMENSAPQNLAYIQEEKQILSPYQQQQLDSWKNRIHKFLLDAWPYLYRFINEALLIVLKVARGSVRIAKEQLLRN